MLALNDFTPFFNDSFDLLAVQQGSAARFKSTETANIFPSRLAARPSSPTSGLA
jgi:hypothetical protein